MTRRRNTIAMDTTDEENLLYVFDPSQKQVSGQKKVVTLRESNGDTEQTFYGESYLVDQTKVTTFKGAGQIFVPELYDSKNNNFKISQASASYQPEYIQSGINGIPSLGCVSDGVNFTILDGDFSPDIETPATIFSVVDVQGSQGALGNSFFGTNDLYAADMFKITLTNTNWYLQGRNSSNSSFTSQAVAGSTGAHVWTFMADGIDKIWVYKDGVLQTSHNPYTVSGGFKNKIRRFRTCLFTGLEAPTYCFKTMLPDRKIQSVVTQLKTIYGIV